MTNQSSLARHLPLALLLIIALAAGTVAGMKIAEASAPIPADGAEHFPQSDRLLATMHQFQTFSGKLYFAGSNRNAELAAWYSWKLESALKELQEGKVEPYAYNGWDAAELSHALNDPISQLNRVIEQGDWDRFDSSFDSLMNTCNGCHIATEHPFVRVRAPRGEVPPAMQDFTPQESQP